jgi:hypothetical protein
METVFKLKATELDSSFVKTIKNLFKDQEIEISIRTAKDETEYLLSSVANKNQLIKAIEQIKNNQNLVSFSGEEFEDLAQKLMRK